MAQQVRIIVKRRQQIDLEKLARALLEHVESLSADEIAEPEAVERPTPKPKRRGSK